MVSSENEESLNFEVSGKITEIKVKVGDKAAVGQELATIDNEDLQGKVTIAEANLNSAKARMAQLREGTGQTDLQIQQISVESALYDLNKAEDELDELINDPEATEEDIEAAGEKADTAEVQYNLALLNLDREEISVESADDELENAEDDLDLIQNDPSSTAQEIEDAERKVEQMLIQYDMALLKLEMEEISVESALYSLNKAEDELDDLLNNPDATEEEIESAGEEVYRAKNQYNIAVLQLASKEEGPTSYDIIIQQASIIQAEQNYQEAINDFNNATLTSPTSGTVLSVNAKIGEQVGESPSSGSNDFILIADLENLLIWAAVDQVDIPKISKGQDVAITLDALPNKEFKGKVVTIDPNPINTQGVITYNIEISIINPSDEIQLGMTADLKIDLGRKEDVLIVPNLAVRSVEGKKVIRKIIDGAPTDIPVEVGISDDKNTEIISGLLEDDEIVVNVFPGMNQTETRMPGMGGFMRGGGSGAPPH